MLLNPDAMLAPATLAKLLETKPQQVQRLCSDGVIPAKNVGRGRYKKWRVRVADYLEWVKQPDNARKPIEKKKTSLPSHVRDLAGD